jgi:predicted DCC family thiol-disulfide oxidoreductase YuxK
MKIILFDGVCNFCNAAVNFILKHDKDHLFRFSPQQSEKGREILTQYGRAGTDLNAIIFINEKDLLEGMDAVIGISKYLKGYFHFIYLLRFLPRGVTHAAYAFVAKNRYRWFGKRAVCRMPEPGEEELFL